MTLKRPPTVFIEKTTLSDNGFVVGNLRWDSARLIEYCKEKEYKEFEIPLASINLSTLPWNDITNMTDFIYHSNRVKLVSKKHPIILDDRGRIADGWHRVVKAILDGDSTIKAIRIEVMPFGVETTTRD